MARLAPPSPLARLWLVSSVARLAAVVLVVVHTLPAVAVSVTAGGVMGGGWYCTLAAFLGARWRPFYGPCGWWLSCGLSVLLAWPLRALLGWRWRGLIGCAWSLPPLRFGPLQWPPLRSLVHLSSAPALRALAGGAWRCAGGVVRLSKNGRGWRCWRCRLCGGRGGCRTRGAVVARSNGHGLGPCGPLN